MSRKQAISLTDDTRALLQRAICDVLAERDAKLQELSSELHAYADKITTDRGDDLNALSVATSCEHASQRIKAILASREENNNG